MTLQDWGAIGELVGGVTVIVTLVYLGLQIRQYALGMSSATFHSSMQGISLFVGKRPGSRLRGPDTTEEPPCNSKSSAAIEDAFRI